jgi:hypothetical protein
MAGVTTLLRGPVQLPFLNRSGQRVTTTRTVYWDRVPVLPPRTIDLRNSERFGVVRRGTHGTVILDRTEERALKCFLRETQHSRDTFRREVALARNLAHGRGGSPYLPPFFGVGDIRLLNLPKSDGPIDTIYYAMQTFLPRDGWLDLASHIQGEANIFTRFAPETLLDLRDALVTADEDLQTRGIKAAFSEVFVQEQTGDVVFYDFGHLRVLQINALLHGAFLCLTQPQRHVIAEMHVVEDHFLAKLAQVAQERTDNPGFIPDHAIQGFRSMENIATFQTTVRALQRAGLLKIHARRRGQQSPRYELLPLDTAQYLRFLAITDEQYSGLAFFTDFLPHLEIAADTPGEWHIKTIHDLLHQLSVAFQKPTTLDTIHQANDLLPSIMHRAFGLRGKIYLALMRHQQLDTEDFFARITTGAEILRVAYALFHRFLQPTVDHVEWIHTDIRTDRWGMKGLMGKTLRAFEDQFVSTISTGDQQRILQDPRFTQLHHLTQDVLGRRFCDSANEATPS